MFPGRNDVEAIIPTFSLSSAHIIWVDGTGANLAVVLQPPFGIIEVVCVLHGPDGILLPVAAVHQLRGHLALLIILNEAQGEQPPHLFSEALVKGRDNDL